MVRCKDYIVLKLTDQFATDYSDASGTNAFDLNKMEWSKEMELHVQVISEIAEDMVKEALYMQGVLGDDLLITVPVTDEGIKAMMILSREGVNITATAGGSVITAAPDILEQLLYHPLTDQAVSDFISDFESVTSEGQTMLGL